MRAGEVMGYIEYRVIDGNYTNRNPVGYCSYYKGYLTSKLVKLHKCDKRGCGRLCKYDHPYWKEEEIKRKRKKEMKKLKKGGRTTKMPLTVHRRDHMNEVAELCYELAKNKYSLSEEDSQRAFFMGYIHDIGYRFCDNKNEHPEVGFRMMHSDEIAQAVLYHGNPNVSKNNVFLNILNEADLRVNSKGQRVTVKERLDDIASRYGVVSPAYTNPAKLAVSMGLISEEEILR